MSDQELLEAAAKAAGIPGTFQRHWGDSGINADDPDGGLWNPLDDDAQAFRLAVTMGLVVDTSRPSAGQPFYSHVYAEINNTDANAATRRAIVRAAAARANKP